MAKLFIPGPTEVHEDVRAAQTRPQIGHRTDEMRGVMRRVSSMLRTVFATEGSVFVATGSATCIMEGTLRNLVKRKVLSLECGAWSQKWGDMAKANGIAVDRQEVPWGQGHDPDDVRKALKTGAYDTVTMVWSETSTGVLNHLADIAAVVRGFDNVLFAVDSVSALGAAPVAVDALGIDVCLAGTQKALAVPPGLAVFSVSERALARAATVEHRGYYTDFVRFKSSADKDETPSTPATSLIFALEKGLERVLKEGLEARYARHQRMARMCQAWAREHFALYTDERFLSPSVCCIANSRKIDVAAYLGRVKERGFSVSNGYSKLKGQTFRIGHFGEHTEDDVRALLAAMTAAL